MARTWTKFVHPSELNAEVIVRAVEGGLVGSLAFLIGEHMIRQVGGPGSIVGAMWSAIAGLVVLQTGRADILRFSMLQAVGTLVGAAISAIFLLWLPPSLWGLALCTCLTTVACYALGIPDQARLASAATVVIMGVGILEKAGSPIVNAELRFVESLIGLALAVAVSYGFTGLRWALAKLT